MSVAFKPPSWAVPPSASCHLEVHDTTAPTAPPLALLRLDAAPHATLGSGARAAVPLPGSGAAPLHAGVAHHASGKVYIIPLVAEPATYVDSLKLEPNKPLSLKDGFKLRFAADATRVYTVRLGPPASGERPAKRPREERPPVISDGRTVRASHLLVKHAGSRNPSSWKEAVVTRSEAEAVELLHGFEARLEAGSATFAELAAAESHCSSAKRGGDLGVFGRGKMQRPFEEAAFGLAVGGRSGVVYTESGVHLILRTE